MSSVQNQLREFTERKYQYGFVTELDTDEAPRGLNEDIIRLISTKKNEPEWRAHLPLHRSEKPQRAGRARGLHL